MPGKMAVIFGVSNILWMILAASQAFKIEIVPESQIVAQINASASLTCRTTGCEAPSFSWRTQIDSPLNGQVRSAGSMSVLTMDPVSFGNEHSYLCTATCGARKEEKAVEVLIYSFPRDPEIQLSGPLEVGKPVTATCLVRDVYPFERLEMDLLKGDRLLKNQEFLEPAETKSLETKGVEVTFTPTDEDIGEALVCRAQLHINEIDAELRKRETTKTLQVQISPRNTVVSVIPSTRLQEGGSVTMTCSSEGLPAPQITWSKVLDKGQSQLLSGNGTLTLIAMRVEDSGVYVCEGVNPAGRDRKEVELIVQEKPFTVEVSPGPQVAAGIGDSVVLTCSAVGCEAPSFSWRTQIDSPLNGQVRKAEATSQLTLSPVSFEHEHSYLCTVTCGRRKQEKRIKVDLYSFPRDPEIEMSGGLVDGEAATVRCKVPDVYPLDLLQIQLLKGERLMESKNFLEAEEKDSLETGSVEMTFIPTADDTGKVLVCQAKLQIDDMEFEPKQRQSTQTLCVQIAPRNITISVSPSSTLEEGQAVNLTCSSDGFPAPRIQWSRQLRNGSLQLLSENTTLTLTSARRGDSGIYVCEGSNQAGTSRKEVELSIQVTPQDMQLRASPSERVQEGDTVTIYCTCGNYPKTWIILKKKAETGDTVLKSVEGAYIIHKAQLEDAGVYECESKSELGWQFRSITLDVKVCPRNRTISIHPPRHVKGGDSVTITCKTFSHPPVVLVLKRVNLVNGVALCPDSGALTWALSTTQSVWNQCGQRVCMDGGLERERDYFSPGFLMLYCASSLLIPAVGMIIYFARRANMKGSYSLVDAQKSKV